MSGRGDEQSAMAAEYVLGLVDEATARAIEAEAARDPALAAEIARWTRDLAGLLTAPPPQAVWARIATTAGVTPAPLKPAAGLGRGRRGVVAAAVAVAVVAALALAALWERQGPTSPPPVPQAPVPSPPVAPAPAVAPPPAQPEPAAQPPSLLTERPPEPPPAAPSSHAPAGPGSDRPLAEAALLPPHGGTPLRATVSLAGDLTLRAPAPIAVAAGQRLHIWFLPRGAARPRLLGELPSGGGVVPIGSSAPAGTPIGGVVMVTEDPESAPARPIPGRTRFQGLLRRAGS